METILNKNSDGYGYKYTDIAEIHKYLEENGMKYYQEIQTSEINGFDYIMTYRFINGKWEEKPKRGCKVVDATLQGIKNPAQEQGSALTYARRYSLLMAFGLATDDDDAQSLTSNLIKTKEDAEKVVVSFGKYEGKTLKEIMEVNENYLEYLREHTTDANIKAGVEILKPLPSEEEQQSNLTKITKVMELVRETGTDLENMLKAFKVNDLTKMNDKQLDLAIKKLEEKLGE